jgi:hypothetical protein
MSTLYIVQIWDQEESKGHFAVCNTHLQIMHNTWILFQFTSKTLELISALQDFI